MPSEAETQAAVTEFVRLWLAAKGVRKRELAGLLGMTPDNLTHTITTVPPRRKWSVRDVRVLVSVFGVPAEVLWGDAPGVRGALVLELELELLERL